MSIIFDYDKENQAIPYDDNIYHVLDNAKFLFEQQNKQLEYWKRRARDIEDEKWSDKEMVRLGIERDNAIQDLRRGFGITEEEKNDIQIWMDKHVATQHNGKWRHCDLFTYEFTPTNLGVLCSVYCRDCINKANKAVTEGTYTMSIARALYDAEYIFRDV